MPRKTTCHVCSEEAPGYKLYGSNEVCSACRAFFIRETPLQSKDPRACYSGDGNCVSNKSSRNSCRSCRYKKCIESGLRPDLVKQRKNKKASKVLSFPSTSSPSSDLCISPLDYFQDGTVLDKIFYLLDETFFEYNQGQFKRSSLDTFSNMVQEHEVSQISIQTQFSSVVIAKESNEVFLYKFLKLFFPSFKEDTLLRMQTNIRITIQGIIRALHSSLQFSDLMDQMKTIFFTSEKYMTFFEDKFPRLSNIEPFATPPLPQLHNEEREFIGDAFNKVKMVKEHDLVPLFFILALFTPVDEEYEEKEIRFILHLHQKAIGLFYSQLISRLKSRKCSFIIQVLGKMIRLILDLHKASRIIHAPRSPSTSPFNSSVDSSPGPESLSSSINSTVDSSPGSPSTSLNSSVDSSPGPSSINSPIDDPEIPSSTMDTQVPLEAPYHILTSIESPPPSPLASDDEEIVFSIVVRDINTEDYDYDANDAFDLALIPTDMEPSLEFAQF